MPKIENRVEHAFLRLALIIDAIFIGCHVLLRSIDVDENHFYQILYGHLSIHSDEALPEIFNFVKWGVSGLLALTAWRLCGHRFYAGLAAASIFFLIDDAGQVHEKIGAHFANTGMSGIGFLDAASLGEISAMGVLALLVVLALGDAYRHGTAAGRLVIKKLAMIIVGLSVVGVIGDIVHNLVYGRLGEGVLTTLAGVIEDGGEMLLISVYASVVFGAFLRDIPKET